MSQILGGAVSNINECKTEEPDATVTSNVVAAVDGISTKSNDKAVGRHAEWGSIVLAICITVRSGNTHGASAVIVDRERDLANT